MATKTKAKQKNNSAKMDMDMNSMQGLSGLNILIRNLANVPSLMTFPEMLLEQAKASRFK